MDTAEVAGEGELQGAELGEEEGEDPDKTIDIGEGEEEPGREEAGQEDLEQIRGVFVGGSGMEEGQVVGSIEFVDSRSTFSAPSTATPEVQGAVDHAHHVSLGLSPPAKTIIVTPLPPSTELPGHPIAPSEEVSFSHVARRPLQEESTLPAPVPLRHKRPARSSSRPTGPAPGSWQGAKPKTSKIPMPTSSKGRSGHPPAPTLPQGHTVGTVPPGVTLETRTLAGLPQQSGYRWNQRKHPYVAWNPTQEELWAAHRLLQGAGEWAVPEITYLKSNDPRLQGQAHSMWWLCPAPNCSHLSANRLDCWGHYQSTHAGVSSSRLWPCWTPFKNGSTLSTHLDLKHNVEPKWVAHNPPFVVLKFVDRVAAPPFGP